MDTYVVSVVVLVGTAGLAWLLGFWAGYSIGILRGRMKEMLAKSAEVLNNYGKNRGRKM